MSSTDTPIEPHDASLLPQEEGGKGSEELARAQRERPREQVGAPYGHGAIRRVTSDELDPHRDWTVQSGRPFPQEAQGRTTRFHPAELPDPQKAVAAGLLPQVLPPQLIDSNHITQPPTENVPLDHPLRGVNPDPGYEASQATNVEVGLEAAEAQRRLTGSWEDRNGEAGDIDTESDLPEVGSEYDRAEARAEAVRAEQEDDGDEENQGGAQAAQGGDPQGVGSSGPVAGDQGGDGSVTV